ncbi:hypothetical protein [Alicyclobacillus cellulosilyticus]|uniref:hypothetical protein n=1 Tax=Alicyclobacillus cellulosilyticus TaxID=1003997 RepID=UPI0016657EF9|nr:hypothetical protein [Alicyclobacillus cellulosilyticus]
MFNRQARVCVVTGVFFFAWMVSGCAQGQPNAADQHPSQPHHSAPGGPAGAAASTARTLRSAPAAPTAPATPAVPVKVLGLRKFPYPYQAMLAISSDADHETLRKFNLIHQFLNTTKMTPMGRGLGLDVADSFFMYNASNLPGAIDYDGTPIHGELSYFRGTSGEVLDGRIIDRYIHCGWMDTMHTYGDFSMRDPRQTMFRRTLAAQALATLRAHHDFVTVWTDHGNPSNVDNFGSYGVRRFFRYQQGANPNSPYYHTDLLIPYGVRFVWSDQQSDVFGHDSMLYPIRLPDGRRVWGFWRYTILGYTRHHRSEWVWSVDHLSQQLSLANLRSIERRHQYAILAQHLCADNEVRPLPENGISALRMLAHEYRSGRILVARTSRLLTYNLVQRCLRYYVTQENGLAVIHVTEVADPVFGTRPATLADLRGVTFYTTDPARTQIRIWNVPLADSLLARNPSDGYAPSIMVKWYPEDHRDYSGWT